MNINLVVIAYLSLNPLSYPGQVSSTSSLSSCGGREAVSCVKIKKERYCLSVIRPEVYNK